MRLTLTQEEAGELEVLAREALSDMSHEIAVTDNSLYRGQLVARRHALEKAVEALRRAGPGDVEVHRLDQPGPERVWTVEVIFTEDEDRTRADARMHATRRDWHGWGRARRNPLDPDVPAIGEELAAARALADLSHQLVDAAAHGVEAFEGHPVTIHG